MDARFFLDIYNDWYRSLKQRERYLYILSAMALSALLYFSLFIIPVTKHIKEYKKEIADLGDKQKIILSQLPDVEKTKLEIAEQERVIKTMKLKAENIQSKLLGASQVPKLLMQLVQSAQGMPIDFQSVKQKTESPDKDGVSRLYIDLKFEASYENAVNYIKKIEEVSTYVKIDEIDLAQSKVDPRNLVSVSLKLNAILALSADAQGEFSYSVAKDAATNKVIVQRSPLTPKISVGQVKKDLPRLSGITFRNQPLGSSAILNDNVVKVGDEVAGYKVESILPDSVMVNDGIESKEIKSER